MSRAASAPVGGLDRPTGGNAGSSVRTMWIPSVGAPIKLELYVGRLSKRWQTSRLMMLLFPLLTGPSTITRK